MADTVPIALFAYSRPFHLTRVLECLCADNVPLIYAFSDGPKTSQAAAEVAKVREVLRSVDWCEVILLEREENWGLGRSILHGVASVLTKHSSIIVFEDDIECVPGTYPYLSSALEHYADNKAVMSVTGWTNPRVTPSDVIDKPYFDGRAECWAWSAWPRSWKGMDQDAVTMVSECLKRGIDIYRYGPDLPRVARLESKRNMGLSGSLNQLPHVVAPRVQRAD